MRGDGAPRDAAGGETPRTRKGPRHAAPRKSLLTKLQIPAGKAMALAAMPTAVFVGMGLTPRLALAEDSKDIPFAPGPCVTRSDGPDASASPSPSASGSSKPDGSPSGSPAPSGSGQDERSDGERSPSGDGGTGDTGDAADAGASRPGTAPSPSSSGSPAPTPTPTPAPTPTKTRNPLDPLGLGDALGGLFGGDGKKETADPEPGATADRPADTDPGTSSGEAADKDKAGADDADKAADNGTDKGADAGTDKGAGKKKDGSDTASDGAASDDTASDDTDDADDAADETRKSIEEAARKAGASVEELDDAAKGLEARKDDDIPSAASGKEPFPCPTPDPDALAAAEEEPGIPLLPDDPWTLHSTLLTLRGLDYKGIVEVRTAGGEVKKALKFTSTSIDIKDLHQTVVYPEGKTGNVKAAEGSTSTFRGGEVTMYTEKLTGNLFGIVPITFSPETPPPLNVPYAFFTDVEVIQAGQFGGTLTVPGLRNYLTD